MTSALRRRSCAPHPAALASAAAILLPTLLPALPIQFGEVTGSLDTTLSVGGAWRLEGRDPRLLGTPVGGTQRSVNADDGNLNQGEDLFSLAFKATHDLELNYGDWGAFVRATYFWDREVYDGDGRRTNLTPEARERAGRDAEILDAYLVGQFDLAGRPVTVRAGNVVLSWGESTFIQNGINVINPIDVAKLRLPGSELREGLVPVPLGSVAVDLTESLSLEAFVQTKWKRTEIDPPGTYFSTNDFAGRGGSRVYLGFGAIPDSAPFGFVGRGRDGTPEDGGQAGLALRYFAEGLNSTEFGLFVIQYHSRLPVVSARTPTTPISTTFIQQRTVQLIGTGLSAAAAQAQATQEAFFQSAGTGRYIIEYPEDITLVGLSFNTSLASTGISIQGEVSWKGDQPLQADDVELLFAALSAINPAFGANNQLGNYLGQLDTYVPGFRRHDVWQAQTTLTKVTSPALGAAQWAIVAEIGATHVSGLPGKGTLRYDAPGTFTSGSAAAMTGTGNGTVPATPESWFADATSFGYQVAVRGEYNNLIFGMNVSPILALAHDVSGTTPLPIGNFVEDRRTLTLGVDLLYQNAWGAELRYVNYSGAGARNLLSDRDFVSATIKYSF